MNNEEENILLQITRMEEGVAMQCRCKGLEDLEALSFSVASLAKEEPSFGIFLLIALRHVMTQKNNGEMVEVPDFDEILKNIK